MSTEVVISSPFMTFVKKKGVTFKEKEYVSFKEVSKVADGFDSSRPYDYLIQTEVIEDERVPIKEEINSHRSRVGLKNMLKGIVSSKQMNDLIARTASSGGFIDATKLPDSQLAMETLAGSIDKVWDSIPVELKKDLTKEDFVKAVSADQIKAYAEKVIASQKKDAGKVE